MPQHNDPADGLQAALAVPLRAARSGRRSPSALAEDFMISSIGTVVSSIKYSMIVAYVIFFIFVPLTVTAAEVLGEKPRHVWGGPSSVPNDQAITKRIWAPGIDDGYVPQGVTWADGAIFFPAIGALTRRSTRVAAGFTSSTPRASRRLGNSTSPRIVAMRAGLPISGMDSWLPRILGGSIK